MEPSSNSMNENKWQDISEEIKKIFKTAVKLLYEKGKMKHSQAKRYLSSGKVQIIFVCSFIIFSTNLSTNMKIYFCWNFSHDSGKKNAHYACLRLKPL